MRYLKTYKSVNESTLGDLSFEDFQDLFVDITDKWDDFNFYNHDEDFSFNIYEFSIGFDFGSTPSDEGRVNNDLDFIYHSDSDNIQDSIFNIENSIFKEKNKISENITYLNSLLKTYDEIERFLLELKDHVVPKMVKFSNCEIVKLHVDKYDIILEFYIK